LKQVTHMPPELLRLGKLSPAGDVYAFAIIMWELFTGCAAFDKQHYGEVFEVGWLFHQVQVACLAQCLSGVAARVLIPVIARADCSARAFGSACPAQTPAVLPATSSLPLSQPPDARAAPQPPPLTPKTPASPPQRVVLRDERPPIPEGMPEAYALLMTRCWQADPMSRPGFDTVLRLINIMIEDLVPDGDGGLGAPEAGAAASGDADTGGAVSGGAGGSGAALGGNGSGGGARGGAAGPKESSRFFQDL
jgi:hypothetical protein